MTSAEMNAMCTHAPAYQKGCIPCSVRYVKMLRSPDQRLSRQKQNEYLASLPGPIANTVKDILAKERQ
jgi:hypothetical protein